MDKLLNPTQLSEILGVKTGTVYSWISRGVSLPLHIKIGGIIRWQERTVKAWIEERERMKKKRNFEL